MATQYDNQEALFAQAPPVPAGVKNDITLGAMSREAVKDVRNMFMEVFFGKPEHGGELGAPMNPLASDLIAARDHSPESHSTEQSIEQGREHGR